MNIKTNIKKCKKIIKHLLPYWIVSLHDKFIEYNRIENKIRRYFCRIDKEENDEEVKLVCDFFKKNQLTVSPYPYAFTENYNASDIIVYHDEICKMKYVIYRNKKCYFPRNWDYFMIQKYYNSLRIEQDINSPHKYETESYTVKKGDVIADVGAAEGIWALTYAEEASEIYIFECDNLWEEPLCQTFLPWKDKVFLVKKFVSDRTESNIISLDDYFKSTVVNFIKADIEGAEESMLIGAEKFLSRQADIKIVICTYHKQDDGKILKTELENIGFETEYSKGYMFPIPYGETREPYMRRGLIRGMKSLNK